MPPFTILVIFLVPFTATSQTIDSFYKDKRLLLGDQSTLTNINTKFYDGDHVDPSNSKNKDVNVCSAQCSECSVYNGCLTCMARHFLTFYWEGMRQMGKCVATCPEGYYAKIWNPRKEKNRQHGKCSKCTRKYCEQCTSNKRCVRCRNPYVLYRGKCLQMCPAEAPMFDPKRRRCLVERPDNCYPSKWTDWSKCSFKNNHTCIGIQVRTRAYIYRKRNLQKFSSSENLLQFRNHGKEKQNKILKEKSLKKIKSFLPEEGRAKKVNILKSRQRRTAAQSLGRLAPKWYQIVSPHFGVKQNYNKSLYKLSNNEVTYQCPDDDYDYNKCFRKSSWCKR